jgi:hypothetical protein
LNFARVLLDCGELWGGFTQMSCCLALSWMNVAVVLPDAVSCGVPLEDHNLFRREVSELRCVNQPEGSK